MKIAVIVPSLVNMGPVLVAKDIISLMDNYALDTEVHVYYFDKEVEINIPCLSYHISLWDKIDFDGYDIIHTHMLRPDFFIWLNKRAIKKARLISTLHQNIYDNLKSSYNSLTALIVEKIWLRFLSAFDQVAVLTETMKLEYSRKLPNQNFTTIYNGRQNNDLLESEALSQNDLNLITSLKEKFKIIGVTALLTNRKGIDQLIKALPLLTDFALIIIGNGKEYEKLVQLSISLNLEGRCMFLGYKPNALKYLKFFDVYAMVSYSEGFPLVLLEAAQSRLAAVCSKIDIFEELFSSEEVSFFELRNIKSLAMAIRTAEENSQIFSEKLFKKVQNNYSVEKMAHSYFSLYKGLLS